MKKNHNFFPKNTYNLFNKTKIWTFWEVLLFYFTANLLLVAILKKFKNSSEKPIYFSSKQKLFLELLGNLTKQYSENLLPVAIFKIFRFFLEKPICFLREKCPAFSTVLRNPTYSVAFYRNFATFSDFKNTLDIFWKNEAYCQKPIFWTFEELILIESHSEANLLPFRFFIEITICFSKKPSIFRSAKAKYWTFWEIFLFQSDLTASLPLLATLKIQDFFRKSNLFSE